jgi:hypothetical protein
MPKNILATNSPPPGADAARPDHCALKELATREVADVAK